MPTFTILVKSSFELSFERVVVRWSKASSMALSNKTLLKLQDQGHYLAPTYWKSRATAADSCSWMHHSLCGYPLIFDTTIEASLPTLLPFQNDNRSDKALASGATDTPIVDGVTSPESGGDVPKMEPVSGVMPGRI